MYTAPVLLAVCAIAVAASSAAASHRHGLDSWSLVYGVASRARARHSPCHEQLRETAAALANNTRWAVKMQDASGTPQGGLYWGNTFWLGSRAQCLVYSQPELQLSILPSMRPRHPHGAPPFPVAYYVVYARHDSAMQTRLGWSHEDTVAWGACLPASCSPALLEPLVREYLQRAPLPLQRTYDMTLLLLHVKQTREAAAHEVDTPLCALFKHVTVLLMLLMAVGTVYEAYWTRSGTRFSALEECGSLHRALTGFSVNKNFHKIFNMDKDTDMLLPLNGWRVISITLMVINHIVGYNITILENKMVINYVNKSHLSQLIFNTNFGIDSFLLVSGFLVGYYFFKDNDIRQRKSLQRDWKNSAKAFSKGVLKRYLRLTPPYLYIILWASAMYARLSPTANLLTPEDFHKGCSEYWWTNLLYLNNLHPNVLHGCLSWSYYLANEMQYYVMGSFLLHLAAFNVKLSVSIGACIATLSAGVVCCLVVVHQYYPYLHLMLTTVNTFYSPPWIRVGTYLAGVLLSCLYTYHRDLVTGRPMWQALGWVVCGGCGYYAVFGLLEKDVTLWYSAVYMATSRQAWALAALIFFYALLTGNVYERVSAFYSYEIWIPLSRLCYGAYLVNPVIIYLGMLTAEKGMYLLPLQTLTSALGVVVLTFVTSFLLTLCVEMPLNNLVNIYLPGRSKKPPPPPRDQENKTRKE